MRETRQSNPSRKNLPLFASTGGKSKSYKKKPSSDHHVGALSALQKRFPEEDFTQISPEWQLNWCKSRAEVEKELLLISPPYDKNGYNGVRSEDWDKLKKDVIDVFWKHKADDHLVKVERIAGQVSERRRM